MLHNIKTEELGPRGEAMAKAVGTCVHCGFCLPACPTYQELESEMDSPRGRILLMKSVLEGELEEASAQPHIDRCLGCLACVTHCPSGVEYGELVTSYRDHIRETAPEAKKLSYSERLRNWIVRHTLPYPRRFRWALRLGLWTKPLGRFAPKALRPMIDLLPEKLGVERTPEYVPAEGERRGRVALLAGCGQQVLAPEINGAAARILAAQGIDVLIPSDQGCCGALAWHTGEGRAASKFATDLISKIPDDVDCFLTTAAGCGSAIHEYPLLLAGAPQQEAAQKFAQQSMDISVYLNRLELRPFPSQKLHNGEKVRIAYHDACHLAHAQKVRSEPRQLLKRLPGVELVELSDCDTCCGSAGTYNIEQPDIADQLGKRKAQAVIDSGASIVATGNIGCLVQLQKHLKSLGSQVTVLHTVQVLENAYQEVLG